jgi:hypothetical protein
MTSISHIGAKTIWLGWAFNPEKDEFHETSIHTGGTDHSFSC